MPHHPHFSVGSIIEEVDETGAVHHYWILAIAKPLRNPALGIDQSREVVVEGGLASAAAEMHPGQRISWDPTECFPEFALG